MLAAKHRRKTFFGELVGGRALPCFGSGWKMVRYIPGEPVLDEFPHERALPGARRTGNDEDMLELAQGLSVTSMLPFRKRTQK